MTTKNPGNLFRKIFIPWKDGQILAFALKKSEKKIIKVMKAVIEWLLLLCLKFGT